MLTPHTTTESHAQNYPPLWWGHTSSTTTAPNALQPQKRRRFHPNPTTLSPSQRRLSADVHGDLRRRRRLLLAPQPADQVPLPPPLLPGPPRPHLRRPPLPMRRRALPPPQPLPEAHPRFLRRRRRRSATEMRGRVLPGRRAGGEGAVA